MPGRARAPGAVEVEEVLFRDFFCAFRRRRRRRLCSSTSSSHQDHRGRRRLLGLAHSDLLLLLLLVVQPDLCLSNVVRGELPGPLREEAAAVARRAQRPSRDEAQRRQRDLSLGGVEAQPAGPGASRGSSKRDRIIGIRSIGDLEHAEGGRPSLDRCAGEERASVVAAFVRLFSALFAVTVASVAASSFDRANPPQRPPRPQQRRGLRRRPGVAGHGARGRGQSRRGGPCEEHDRVEAVDGPES